MSLVRCEGSDFQMEEESMYEGLKAGQGGTVVSKTRRMSVDTGAATERKRLGNPGS